jgi:membrane protease subunit (stomatin/prohibitin family)
MSQLSEIYDGWKNYVFQDPQVEELAKKRMGICVECKKLNNRNFCMTCGCFMPAKVRSLHSKCSLKKW